MIAVRDLSLALDGRSILERVSFDVSRGEAVALVGANGSGKTSILRCLLGFVPFTGRVTIEGHDVVHEPIVTRSLVGYVPQRAAFGDARAGDVLAFVAALRRIERPRIEAMLALVGLAGLALSLLIGFEADTLRRWGLRRRGWAALGTVTGKTASECERRFFDAWLPMQPILASGGQSQASAGGWQRLGNLAGAR